jgi:chaperonin GroES
MRARRGSGEPGGKVGVKVHPIQDRILVKRLDAEEKTAGGIIIPDSAKEKPQQAEVIAVGAGKWSEDGKRLEPAVKKGDRVLFSKYSGSEVTLDGEEHLIIREDDILAILD